MERVGNLLGQVAKLKPRLAASDGPHNQGAGDTSQQSPARSSSAPSTTEVLKPRGGASLEAGYREQPAAPRRRRAGVPSDLTKIKAILSRALAHKGLDKKIERYEFILHWEEIVGESLARISKPECILNKTLLVRVTHSTWAQELAFMKPVLIQKVRPYLKRGDVIDDIVFRIGSVS